MNAKLRVVAPAPSGADDLLLITISNWHVARAQTILSWSLANQSDRFGSIDEAPYEAPSAAIDEMKHAVRWLERLEPVTIRGACELLNVALLILQDTQRDPECVLGEGSVIDMVHNARAALDYADPDTRIGPRGK